MYDEIVQTTLFSMTCNLHAILWLIVIDCLCCRGMCAEFIFRLVKGASLEILIFLVKLPNIFNEKFARLLLHHLYIGSLARKMVVIIRTEIKAKNSFQCLH